MYVIDVLTEKEKEIWKDASEYFAIEGREICENTFNTFFGLPKNMGHGGISSAFILTPELNSEPEKTIISFNFG